MKQRSREGLEAARAELEEREKVGEELLAIQMWLQAAHGLLSEMEQSSSTEELQVGGSSSTAASKESQWEHTVTDCVEIRTLWRVLWVGERKIDVS